MALNLRNAWWLMDAAFLAYSAPAQIRQVFGDMSANVQTFSGPLTTQCYVADAEDWIVLAFRGTQADEFWPAVVDWSVDARFLPAPDVHGDWVHAGFRDAIQEVWADVAGYLRALRAESPRPLWIAGHSLGAALATVAANRCSDERDQLGLAGVYSFGCPRAGDRAFGGRIGSPVWRLRNNSDLVTNLPLGLVFAHVGNLAFIDGSGYWHEGTSTDQVLLELPELQLSPEKARDLHLLLSGAPRGLLLPGFLADHAPVNYAIRIWNCYEASVNNRR